MVAHKCKFEGVQVNIVLCRGLGDPIVPLRRVVNIEPSIGAAFVNFGGRSNGFLHVSDVLPAYGGDEFSLEDIIEGRARVSGEEGPDAVRSVLTDDDGGSDDDVDFDDVDDPSDEGASDEDASEQDPDQAEPAADREEANAGKPSPTRKKRSRRGGRKPVASEATVADGPAASADRPADEKAEDKEGSGGGGEDPVLFMAAGRGSTKDTDGETASVERVKRGGGG